MKPRGSLLAIPLLVVALLVGCDAPSTSVQASAPPTATEADPQPYLDFARSHSEAKALSAWLAGIELANTKAYLEADHAQKVREAAERRARARKARQTTYTAATASAAPQGAPAAPGFDMECGGDLPPCYVLNRESKGDLRVWNGHCYYPVGYAGSNRCGSTASGKWQFLRSTWNGYGGYLNAADAPAEVQNAKARELWAGGRGCSHWSAC